MSAGNEMVTVSSNHPAMAIEDDGFTPSAADMVLPRFKIAQALTREVQDGTVRPGEIVNSVTGESYGNSITFVVLRYSPGRLYFQNGVGLVCRSNDGRTAYGDPFGAGEPGPQSCVTCPFKEWTNGAPPPCAEAHNYLILLPDTLEVGSLTLMKSGAKTAKLLNTMIAQARERSRRNGGPRVAWVEVYELSTRKQDAKKGPFYAPVVRPVGPADEGVLAYATEMFGQLQTTSIAAEEAPSTAGSDLPTEF